MIERLVLELFLSLFVSGHFKAFTKSLCSLCSINVAARFTSRGSRSNEKSNRGYIVSQRQSFEDSEAQDLDSVLFQQILVIIPFLSSLTGFRLCILSCTRMSIVLESSYSATMCRTDDPSMS